MMLPPNTSNYTDDATAEHQQLEVRISPDKIIIKPVFLIADDATAEHQQVDLRISPDSTGCCGILPL